MLAKVRRLLQGCKPRVLDIFSGAGGISLGFQRAGFQIDGALEIDVDAARTHALNFHPNAIGLHAHSRDMTRIEPEELIAELGLGEVDMAIDVLVGGPPCQAYARVGRAKLREIAEHPEAYKVDPRGNLFLRYLAYVKELRPLAVMMENVPDALRYGGHNIMQEMADTLDSIGYNARYSLINAAFHGIPQMRDRVFLVAYRKELRAKIEFPKATHHVVLPKGYENTRTVALRFVDLLSGSGYLSPDFSVTTLPKAVTAGEAIGDLPKVTGTKVKSGPKRFSREAWLPYRKIKKISSYAQMMREWPGFEADGGVIDHAIRYLPRDHLVFAAMRQGAEYPEAKALAIQIARDQALILGIDRRTKQYKELYGTIVPPYDDAKFSNKWWKLIKDFPVRTLMAHLGKDCYSHIHYDDKQARTISVREAARLQSFPDGFRFSGTMNPAFKQIGNAVPPLVATAIAEIMHVTLMTAVKAMASLCDVETSPVQDAHRLKPIRKTSDLSKDSIAA